MKKTLRIEYVKRPKRGGGYHLCGPYAYFYWKEGGKLRKEYHGKVQNEVTQPEAITLTVTQPEPVSDLQIARELIGYDPDATFSENRRTYRCIWSYQIGFTKEDKALKRAKLRAAWKLVHGSRR